MYIRLLKKIFADLENLKWDPLLLHLLVYLSTENDVDILLDHPMDIPVHIVAIHALNQCQQYNKLFQKKVNVCIYIYIYLKYICIYQTYSYVYA